MSAANKDLVRRHFDERWNRRDLAVADEPMAESAWCSLRLGRRLSLMSGR